MKACKFISAVTLCCFYLWWSCACDSNRDIPLDPQNSDNAESNAAPLSQEQLLNAIDETKNADNPDVNFSESVKNVEKLGSTDHITGNKPSQADTTKQIPDSEPPQEVDVGQNNRVEKITAFAAEEVIQNSKSVEDENSLKAVVADGVASEAKSADHPPHQAVGKESTGSQNASPSPSVATKEDISPSNVDVEQGHPHSEEMPLFDEWKKMMLAEQDDGGQKKASPGPSPGKKLASQKRRRNYASYECGSKLVASNSEGEGTSRILTELVDEYMLNPCHVKIWFVIELCESVQASQIELANFELFSSLPKTFAVYSSSNFPTRDWIPLGTFTAAEQRVLQSFPLKQEGYGKFIKIELLSHYGNEYYCPLSVVRIFGTSMVDEYEEMETLSSHPVLQDDDLDRIVDLPVEHKSPTTIFGSATDAVYNIVKKAAQVLLPHQQVEGEGSDKMDHNVSEAKRCKLHDKECVEESKAEKSPHAKAATSDFLASVSSIHPTLFHHLRRCEQCVKSSKPSYHSISEPQCRFFQAAMGPVLFTSICDWFRDHHLTTITRHQMPIVDATENATSSISKMISPPPVIRVIIESNQSDSQPLPSITNASAVSQKSDETTRRTSELPPYVKPLESTLSEGLRIESEIKPTKTTSPVIDGSHVDLSSVVDADPSSVVPLSENLNSLYPDVPPPVEDLVQTDSLHITVVGTEDVISPSLTPVPTAEPPIVSNETTIASEVESTTEEPSTITMIPTAIEITTDDFTEALKSGDDRFVDTKDSGMKLETVSVGGMSGQKESVFIRMNNRIKALELNMSLSSQYLQELSRRYRRQMEEMQRSFNRTVGTLNDTARKAAERDLKQEVAIENLQAQVANMTLIIDQLVTERSAVMRKMLEVHVFLMVVEAIIMITIMSLCVRRVSSVATLQHQLLTQNVTSPTCRKRRSSTESPETRTVPKIKKRSSSEEAISSGNQLLIVEPSSVAPLPKGKKRNRKKKGIRRSASNPTMSPSKEANGPGKKYIKERGSAAGIIFSHANAKSELESENLNGACENCNKGGILKYNEKGYVNIKEMKRNSSPLKNLTNGDLGHYIKPVVSRIDLSKEKEKFSFRKFLKFQKRESI